MENNKMKILFKSLKYSFGLLIQSSRLAIFIYLILKLLISSLIIVDIYLISRLIDELLINRSVTSLVLFFSTCYILSIAISPLLNLILNRLYIIIFDKGSFHYDSKVIQKVSLLSLSFIDSSKGKDLITDARYIKNTAVILPIRLINLLSYLYTFVVSFVYIFRLETLFSILLVVLTIPSCIIKIIVDRKLENYRLKKAPDVRKFSYYRWMLTDAWPASDVRMYDLTDDIKQKYDVEKQEYIDGNNLINRKKLFYNITTETFKRLGLIFFIIYIIYKLIMQNFTVGEAALITTYAFTIVSSFESLLDLFLITYSRTTEVMGRFFEFQKIEVTKQSPKHRDINYFESLTFKDVSFKYPYSNSEKYVLNNVNFTIKKGQKISIVGLNGSGKTTIVKLITGLYSVSTGEILLNGYNINEYNIQEVRKLFSVMFQNITRYPLSIRENIAMSNLTNIDEDSKIKESLQKGGIYKDLKNHTLDRYMTRRFSNTGIELSSGQWQKIALSRVFLRNSDVIVLDEPSASLDAIAEDRIFKSIKKMSHKKTVIMISHRISTAVHSDLIIVLNEGCIEVIGNHNDLIKKEGLYSMMYNMQKERYVRENE